MEDYSPEKQVKKNEPRVIFNEFLLMKRQMCFNNS